MLSNEAGFLEWAHNHSNSYLGQSGQMEEQEENQRSWVAREQNREETNQSLVALNRVTSALTTLAKERVKERDDSAGKKDDSKAYDSHDMAALMGFCT